MGYTHNTTSEVAELDLETRQTYALGVLRLAIKASRYPWLTVDEYREAVRMAEALGRTWPDILEMVNG